MSDPQLSDLFAEGTAPDSDPDFALDVAAGVGRARFGLRLRALALQAAGMLVLSGVLYVAAGAIRPALAQLLDGAPQVMGAPAPAVVSVLAASALGAGVRRYVLSR